jgi:GntR family transcriptional regulator
MASPDVSSLAVQRKTLHGRLSDDLIRRIRAGEWPVGSSLPAEKFLCEQSKVSRHTLRHALKTLQEQGFIECRQGAASTVISCTQPRIYSQDFNTLRDILRYPRNTYRENQIESYVECDAVLQGVLKAPIGSSWYHIGAIRRDELSKLAMAWTDIYILNKFARVTKLKNHANDMVFEQIERQFGVSMDRAEVEVTSSTLSKEHAKSLEAKIGASCLVIVRRYFDSNGEPFEVSVTRHPENRFSFNMELRSVVKGVGR